MTKYYSNKADFESGSGNTVNKGSSYLNFGGYGDQTADSQVTSLLLDIELVTEVVQEEGVSDQYKPVGDAILGKDMPPNTFITSFNRAKKLLDLAKRVHGEVLERIDGKFTKGIDESLKSLNKVNGSDKPYKTKNLTYKKTQSFTDNYGEVHYYQQTETYKLSELLDQKASPIESTQKVYKEKLKQFRERINTATDMSAKEIAKYKKMSDKELMSTFYHGQISNYSGLKQFKWQEDNKGWLEPIEQHLGIGLFVVSAVATLFSAGITSPTLGAAATFVASTSGTMGTTYSILENGYSTITGNTLISGTALDFDDRVWAAAEAFATVSSFGVGKAFKFAGAADDTLAKVAKTKGVVEDTVHLSHISYNAAVKGEDPTLSLVTFAGGKAVKNISKRVEAKWKNSGSQNGNIDEVTSPKDLSTIKGNNVDTDVPVKPHVDVETSKIKPVEAVAGAATVVPKSKTPDIDVLTKPKDLSTIKGEAIDHVGTVKPKVDLDIPEVKDVHDIEAPKYNKEQIRKNIEESKLARESSGVKDFATEPSRLEYLHSKYGKISSEELHKRINIPKLKRFVKNYDPVEIAKSSQGDFPYTGVDEYQNILIKKGDILFAGEPFPTGYMVSEKTITDVGNNATKLFEGVQVKPYYVRGMDSAEYRKIMGAYKFNEDINSATGITLSNPQFGQGGLTQYFVPDFREAVHNKFIVPVKTSNIKLNNYKVNLSKYAEMEQMIHNLK